MEAMIQGAGHYAALVLSIAGVQKVQEGISS